MKKEYDFSKGERGKFYRQNVRIYLPIYLDEQSLEFVEKIAKRKKADLTSVVNDIIKGDRELAKTLTWEVARYLGVCTSAISKAKNRTVPFSSF